MKINFSYRPKDNIIINGNSYQVVSTTIDSDGTIQYGYLAKGVVQRINDLDVSERPNTYSLEVPESTTAKMTSRFVVHYFKNKKCTSKPFKMTEESVCGTMNFTSMLGATIETKLPSSDDKVIEAKVEDVFFEVKLENEQQILIGNVIYKNRLYSFSERISRVIITKAGKSLKLEYYAVLPEGCTQVTFSRTGTVYTFEDYTTVISDEVFAHEC